MKAARVFLGSAGALWLALALAAFLGDWASREVIQPGDPLFHISTRLLFWIGGAIALFVSVACLFGKATTGKLLLVAWLAGNATAYRFGLAWIGCSKPEVVLGTLPAAFGISPKAAGWLLATALAYLLVGSSALLLWQWLRSTPLLHHSTIPSLKMPCPACGVHIRFPAQNLGQQIPCPQCNTTVTLRKPDLLKMVCFFCKGHIEFPTHAIGQKISCPHCKMDITLKELA